MPRYEPSAQRITVVSGITHVTGIAFGSIRQVRPSSSLTQWRISTPRLLALSIRPTANTKRRSLPSGPSSAKMAGQFFVFLHSAGKRSSMRVHVLPPSSDSAAGPQGPPWPMVQTVIIRPLFVRTSVAWPL